MIEFKGFPARMQFTPIPNIVFSSLFPQIEDITELKVLLYFFALLYPKKGKVRFVSNGELSGNTVLVNDLGESVLKDLPKALESLTQRGAILHLSVNRGEACEEIYFLNNEANRLIIEKIRNGEIVLSGLKPERLTPVTKEEPSDIFTLYEQNIGMLTPLIADELKEAGKLYPEAWIKDAIKTAVSLNKRNWRYVARILERWSTEGKENGAYRRHLKTDTDPDKYIRGKYGHMVQR